MTADRAHHRRLRQQRRGRHPGRPEGVLRARRLRGQRHHGADGPEHAGRAGRVPGQPAPSCAGQIGLVSRRPARSGRSRSACWARPRSSRCADGLERWRPRWIVLDPVIVAKSGDKLLADEAVDALRTRLLPLASLITPNLPEAGVLLGAPAATTRREMGAVAPTCRAWGPLTSCSRAAIWEEVPTAPTSCSTVASITGSRASGCRRGARPRTGCAPIGRDHRALLARGLPLPTAVAGAKRYLAAAIAAADGLGVGRPRAGPRHFHAALAAAREPR